MLLFFSILALIFALVGLIPLLGFLEWIAAAIAVLGVIFSILGVILGKHKGGSIGAIIINILVILIAVVRILLGVGFFVLA